jgi:site-specific recombinase XerD
MTVHGARHTFKSMMLERGYPLHIIAEMMAHSSTSTTAKYGSVSDNAILKKINQ